MSRTTPLFRIASLLIAGLALGVPSFAQWGENGEPLDPGFPENGFSYPEGFRGPTLHGHPGELDWRSVESWLDVTAWPPPSWLPHRGNRQYLHIAEKEGQPLQMFRVMDEDGAPLAGVTVEMQQAGYRAPGIRGVTDESGAFYVTVDKPKRTHRVTFSLRDHRRLVMELSGGPLVTARHEIRLEAGSLFDEPVEVAYVPEVRTAPPGDVLRSYRRGLRALDKDEYLRAARELRLAVERWPMPTTDESADGVRYQPYEALGQALEEMGAEELAQAWQRRAEEVGGGS